MNSMWKLLFFAFGLVTVAVAIIAIIKYLYKSEEDCYLCGDDEDFLF